MDDFNSLPYEDDKELQELLKRYEKMLETGEATYFENYELVDLAIYYYENEDDKNLEDVINLCDKMYPDSEEIFYVKTRFYLKMNKMKKADEQIEKMVIYCSQLPDEEDDDRKSELLIDIKLLKAEASLLNSHPEDAEEYFQEAFDIPDDYERKADLSLQIASVYFLNNNVEDKSVHWLEKAAKLMPDSKPALEMLTFCYNKLKKTKKAKNTLNKLVDKDPYSTYYWNMLGDTCLNNSEYEKAIEAYDFALAINTEDHEALKKKAISFIYLRNEEKAFQLLNKYLEVVPDDYNAMLFKSLCLNHMERQSEAIEILNQIMAETDYGKDDPTVNQQELFAVMVRSHCRNKDYKKALEWVHKGMELGLDKSIMYIVEGSIHMDMGRVDTAKKYYDKAIHDSKDIPQTICAIAIELINYEEYKSAKKILLQLYDEVTDNDQLLPETPGLLAYCYLHLKEYDNYLKYLKEGHDEAPKETANIFGEYITEGMSFEDFYDSEVIKYGKD